MLQGAGPILARSLQGAKAPGAATAIVLSENGSIALASTTAASQCRDCKLPPKQLEHKVTLGSTPH
jgi:hypothetical protein